MDLAQPLLRQLLGFETGGDNFCAATQAPAALAHLLDYDAGHVKFRRVGDAIFKVNWAEQHNRFNRWQSCVDLNDNQFRPQITICADDSDPIAGRQHNTRLLNQGCPTHISNALLGHSQTNESEGPKTYWDKKDLCLLDRWIQTIDYDIDLSGVRKNGWKLILNGPRESPNE